MYWIIWLVLMVAIPVLAGIPLWWQLHATPAPIGDDVVDDRREM